MVVQGWQEGEQRPRWRLSGQGWGAGGVPQPIRESGNEAGQGPRVLEKGLAA